MVMGLLLPAKAQGFLLVIDQGQTKHKKHFEKKEHGSRLI